MFKKYCRASDSRSLSPAHCHVLGGATFERWIRVKPEKLTSRRDFGSSFFLWEQTWLVVSGGRFLMRIFLLLLSSWRVLASLLSISSGSRSGRSRRQIPESEGCAAAASSSSGCRLSGLSISGESALSSAREEWTLGGWMDEAAAILGSWVKSVRVR